LKANEIKNKKRPETSLGRL